jgi:hypothetical protein
MNKFKRASRVASSCIATALCFSANASAAENDGWEWLIVPYGWAASIGTDLTTTSPPSESSTDTDFRDVVDKLDGAFEIHIEGQGDRFGVFADFTYLGLADERKHPRFEIESDLDTRLFEIAGVWNPSDQRFRGVDVFAGLRYIDVDFTSQLKPVNPIFRTVTVDGGETFNDFMVGARYTWAMSERWSLTVRGDGSFGDTEGTWNASAVAQYRTGNGAWVFGYRHLDVELKARGSNTNITMSGPEVGYAFRF